MADIDEDQHLVKACVFVTSSAGHDIGVQVTELKEGSNLKVRGALVCLS